MAEVIRNMLSNEKILAGIRKQDTRVLKEIYSQYYPKVEALILKNSGSQDDARDVFQEGIVAIYNKLKEDDIQLDVKFVAYFVSVCFHIWKNKLRHKRVEMAYMENEKFTTHHDHDFSDKRITEQLQYSLYQKHFRRLKEECKKILSWFLDKVSLKEIAERMGYKSEKYAKKRKYYCKEHLVEAIKGDPEYNELMP